MRLLTILLVLASSIANAAEVFVAGDSTTMQATTYLHLYSQNTIHRSVRNARDSAWSATHILTWMDDPDDNPTTPSPGPYDVIRFDVGIWDAQPLPLTGGEITTAEDFETNILSILDQMRQHSPDANIIWGTSHRIDANRLTLDPPPGTGLLEIDEYNQALSVYQNVILDTLPQLGVAVDDTYDYFLRHSPEEFNLYPPYHENTGCFWNWDGVHWDKNYRVFVGQRMASFIDDVAKNAQSVPEPSGFVLLIVAASIAYLTKRNS